MLPVLPNLQFGSGEYRYLQCWNEIKPVLANSRSPVLANLQFASREEGIFNSHIIVEAPRCGVSAFFVLGCAADMVLRQGLHYISPLPNIRRHSVTWAGVRRNPGGVAAM